VTDAFRTPTARRSSSSHARPRSSWVGVAWRHEDLDVVIAALGYRCPRTEVSRRSRGSVWSCPPRRVRADWRGTTRAACFVPLGRTGDAKWPHPSRDAPLGAAVRRLWSPRAARFASRQPQARALPLQGSESERGEHAGSRPNHTARAAYCSLRPAVFGQPWTYSIGLNR
jgi:hypothetical protein